MDWRDVFMRVGVGWLMLVAGTIAIGCPIFAVYMAARDETIRAEESDSSEVNSVFQDYILRTAEKHPELAPDIRARAEKGYFSKRDVREVDAAVEAIELEKVRAKVRELSNP